ncbi:MAG: hypothetical protein ACRDHY_15855, partial [Anaerolineales bacterium]
MKPRISWVCLIWLVAGCSGSAALPTARPVPPTAAPSETSTLAPATAIPWTATPAVRILDEAAGVEYSIPPTIQHAWPGAAVVYFTLERPAPVSLLVAEGESGGWRMAVESPEEARHLLTVTGLTPGVAYRVAIAIRGLDGGLRPPAFQGESWGPLRLH